MILWAHASLGERMGGACLAALLGQARKELKQFSERQLISLLWSLCIAQVWRKTSAEAMLCSASQHHQHRCF